MRTALMFTIFLLIGTALPAQITGAVGIEKCHCTKYDANFDRCYIRMKRGQTFVHYAGFIPNGVVSMSKLICLPKLYKTPNGKSKEFRTHLNFFSADKKAEAIFTFFVSTKKA